MGTRVDSGGGGNNDLAEAIGLFILGEISLGKAAEHAGVSRWEMESILKDAGVDRQYGPRSQDELDDEVTTALNLE
jgi:predicted HTH domain antitoxin